MLTRVTRIFFIIFTIFSLSACSSYKQKFGGYKENYQLQASEQKSTTFPKSFNMKAQDKTYYIPVASHYGSKFSVEELELPPNF